MKTHEDDTSFLLDEYKSILADSETIKKVRASIFSVRHTTWIA